MRRDQIVTGQKVTTEKHEMARELRRTMTPAERILWQRLRANRLDGRHFRRQQIIDGFIVDFYCHQAGLIIEVDGPIHETQKEADAEREAILTGRGLTVLRFTNQQVMNNMNEVLREIRGYLDTVDSPPSPLPTWEGEPGSLEAEDRDSIGILPHAEKKSVKFGSPDIEDRDGSDSSPFLGEGPVESGSPDIEDRDGSDSPPFLGEGPGEGS